MEIYNNSSSVRTDMQGIALIPTPHALHDCIAYLSPLLYMVFVEFCKHYLPRRTAENAKTIDMIRQLHNIGLAAASLYLCVGIAIAAYQSNKFASFDNLLCMRFNNEPVAYPFGWWFYVSKYWEWLDTAFLIIGGKEVSWLQYTHHMSTAILVYVNIHPIFSALSFTTGFLNTFVHIFMYYYFAYPKGIMRNFRKLITRTQILQHVLCLASILYMYSNLDNCYTTKSGLELALGLYIMYLVFFTLFYIAQYVKGGSKKGGASKKLE